MHIQFSYCQRFKCNEDGKFQALLFQIICNIASPKCSLRLQSSQGFCTAANHVTVKYPYFITCWSGVTSGYRGHKVIHSHNLVHQLQPYTSAIHKNMVIVLDNVVTNLYIIKGKSLCKMIILSDQTKLNNIRLVKIKSNNPNACILTHELPIYFIIYRFWYIYIRKGLLLQYRYLTWSLGCYLPQNNICYVMCSFIYIPIANKVFNGAPADVDGFATLPLPDMLSVKMSNFLFFFRTWSTSQADNSHCITFV